jgi:hypothetical protein
MGNDGVNTEANAVAANLNTGYLNIYSGTKPVTADTGLAGNTLLAAFVLPNPCFGAAVTGVITANAITPVSGLATLTATFYRAMKSDNTTCEWQGDVGAELVLNSSAISTGAQVSVTSWVHTVSK